MKKNSCNFLWLQLKGYDRVRAIHKLKKEINKFGDKLGKKNNILNQIMHRDLYKYQLNDLNITRFYPKPKQIYFSNDLIKSIHYKSNSEEIKNNYNNEPKLFENTATKEIIKDPFEEPEQEFEKKNENLNYTAENKYLKIFTRIKNNKDNKKQIPNQRSIKNLKLSQNTNNKTNNELLSSSRNNTNRTNQILTPKIVNENANVVNYVRIKINKNIKIQKSANHSSNIYKPINNNKKKIIPKMNIIKLKININSAKLKKNYSDSIMNKFCPMKPNNFFIKVFKNKSENKMKKIKLINHQSINHESTRNILGNTTIEKLQQTLNASFNHKGINTSTIPTFNFFHRKRIPSYIRLPYINKVLLPKVDFKKRNSLFESFSSSTSYGSYFFSKDYKNQYN